MLYSPIRIFIFFIVSFVLYACSAGSPHFHDQDHGWLTFPSDSQLGASFNITLPLGATQVLLLGPSNSQVGSLAACIDCDDPRDINQVIGGEGAVSTVLFNFNVTPGTSHVLTVINIRDPRLGTAGKPSFDALLITMQRGIQFNSWSRHLGTRLARSTTSSWDLPSVLIMYADSLLEELLSIAGIVLDQLATNSIPNNTTPTPSASIMPACMSTSLTGFTCSTLSTTPSIPDPTTNSPSIVTSLTTISPSSLSLPSSAFSSTNAVATITSITTLSSPSSPPSSSEALHTSFGADSSSAISTTTRSISIATAPSSFHFGTTVVGPSPSNAQSLSSSPSLLSSVVSSNDASSLSSTLSVSTTNTDRNPGLPSDSSSLTGVLPSSSESVGASHGSSKKISKSTLSVIILMSIFFLFSLVLGAIVLWVTCARRTLASPRRIGEGQAYVRRPTSSFVGGMSFVSLRSPVGPAATTARDLRGDDLSSEESMYSDSPALSFAEIDTRRGDRLVGVSTDSALLSHAPEPQGSETDMSRFSLESTGSSIRLTQTREANNGRTNASTNLPSPAISQPTPWIGRRLQ